MRFVTVSTVARVIGSIILLFANVYLGYGTSLFPNLSPKDFRMLFPWTICLVFAVTIYAACSTRNYIWAIIFAFVLVLYNPIKTYNFDLLVQQTLNGFNAALLFVSIFIFKEDEDRNADSANKTE